MRVAYEADPAKGMTVNLIQSWQRGEIDRQIMSTSGGPKDYIRNDIWLIFDSYPSVARVLMVRGQYLRSTPFLLMVSATGQVADMAWNAVLLES